MSAKKSNQKAAEDLKSVLKKEDVKVETEKAPKPKKAAPKAEPKEDVNVTLIKRVHALEQAFRAEEKKLRESKKQFKIHQRLANRLELIRHDMRRVFQMDVRMFD